jgi:hypothetical protein
MDSYAFSLRQAVHRRVAPVRCHLVRSTGSGRFLTPSPTLVPACCRRASAELAVRVKQAFLKEPPITETPSWTISNAPTPTTCSYVCPVPLRHACSRSVIAAPREVIPITTVDVAGTALSLSDDTRLTTQ